MPTPSTSAPDALSPTSFSFSTCPDQDEPHPVPSRASAAEQRRADTQPAASSSASWQPSSPSYALLESPGPVDRAVNMEHAHSPSETTSPQPRLPGSTGREERDTTGLVQHQGPSDESHKQGDVEEDAGVSSGEEAGTGVVGAVRSAAVVSRETLSRGSRRQANSLSMATTLPRGAPSSSSPSGGHARDVDRWGGHSSCRWAENSSLMGLGYGYAHTRNMPMSSPSCLRPGSRYLGTQHSERQRYDVQVEIKHVDMRESFLCGYLRWQGPTDDNPDLTTYFEGEMIGPQYGFITQHPSWGATEKIDLNHWSKFTAFRPYAKQARKGQASTIDFSQKEHIFMRWKEQFLVPDHRARTIDGASYEGFYYICFNQVRGEVSGIYFHSKSEKFQQLELKHAEDRGCLGALEFR